jgi:hypothetical protein
VVLHLRREGPLFQQMRRPVAAGHREDGTVASMGTDGNGRRLSGA